MIDVIRAGMLTFLLAPIASQADIQDDRMNFIQRLMHKGIFLSTNVEDGVPQLIVTPEFHESDLDSKQTAVGIVYQYYFKLDDSYDELVVIDGSTGVEIGTYTVEGLQL